MHSIQDVDNRKRKRSRVGQRQKSVPLPITLVCLIFNYCSVWPLLKGKNTTGEFGKWSKKVLVEVHQEIHYKMKLFTSF